MAAYYDKESWRARFPGSISQGPRVVKQNRGSQGEVKFSEVSMSNYMPCMACGETEPWVTGRGK